jgi:hypothetical protein
MSNWARARSISCSCSCPDRSVDPAGEKRRDCCDGQRHADHREGIAEAYNESLALDDPADLHDRYVLCVFRVRYVMRHEYAVISLILCRT